MNEFDFIDTLVSDLDFIELDLFFCDTLISDFDFIDIPAIDIDYSNFDL